ncbi:Uncharacterised protein g9892 [Pycnogonum litorale]
MAMEVNMSKYLNDVGQKSEVTGVVCCDDHGLELASSGVVNSQASGAISVLAKHAALLEPMSTKSPVICIEMDKSCVLIKNEGDVTVGIFKSNQSS